MTCYRITNWDELYENNRTRGMKVMQWVPVPNKHDGEGFISLITQPDGLALYGAWHLILQVASKCKDRGVLQKLDGTPHTAESIAIKTHSDASTIQRALDALCAPSVGWMECVNLDETNTSETARSLPAVCPQSARSLPAVCPQSARSLPAVCPHPTDEEGKGRNRRNGIERESPPLDVDLLGQQNPSGVFSPSALNGNGHETTLPDANGAAPDALNDAEGVESRIQGQASPDGPQTPLNRWLKYRGPTYPQESREEAAKYLDGMTPEEQHEAVEYSIRGGYKNLCRPPIGFKARAAAQPKAKAPRLPDMTCAPPPLPSNYVPADILEKQRQRRKEIEAAQRAKREKKHG
jgi:hypothetical protein